MKHLSILDEGCIVSKKHKTAETKIQIFLLCLYILVLGVMAIENAETITEPLRVIFISTMIAVIAYCANRFLVEQQEELNRVG